MSTSAAEPPVRGGLPAPFPEPAVEELAGALRRELVGEVRHDAVTRELYARDASMYAIDPLGWSFPRDADDVAAAVAIAGSLGVPVLPRGAGTSLAGQTVGRAIVIDLLPAHDQNPRDRPRVAHRAGAARAWSRTS